MHSQFFLEVPSAYLTFLRFFILSKGLIKFSEPVSPPTETETTLQVMIALTFRRLLIILLHLHYITVSVWNLIKVPKNVSVLDEPLLMYVNLFDRF